MWKGPAAAGSPGLGPGGGHTAGTTCLGPPWPSNFHPWKFCRCRSQGVGLADSRQPQQSCSCDSSAAECLEILGSQLCKGCRKLATLRRRLLGMQETRRTHNLSSSLRARLRGAGTCISGQEIPHRNTATPACPGSPLGFLPREEMRRAVGLQQAVSWLACSESHGSALPQSSPALLPGPGFFGEFAEAGAVACPAAGCRCDICSFLLLWQEATADTVASVPRKIFTCSSRAGAGRRGGGSSSRAELPAL